MFVCEAVTKRRLLYVRLFRGRSLAAAVVYSHYLASCVHATFLLLLLLCDAYEPTCKLLRDLKSCYSNVTMF
jgi:hypothetical protein